MKISLAWLRTYLNTSALDEEIIQRLNKIGLVVDSFENLGDRLKGFRIAEVLEAKRHPNADRLSVCRVNTGEEELQVVCGAPNAKTGMKAVLARVGMSIPSNGLVLKPTTIREVKSFGMLCSGQELLLEEDSGGKIIELSSDAPVGEEYATYLGLCDAVLDLEITPNRSDCLSHYGVARDLAATEIGALQKFETPKIVTNLSDTMKVTIKNSESCPFFSGRIIKGVKNGPSPMWLQQRLKAVGLRPISALVDITNFMLMAWGRPMHVFDLDKINGHLELRSAIKGEAFKALDGKDYVLDQGMLVIADESGLQSLAGIIGGEASGCTVETTNVFLESAYFNPTAISTTGRALSVLSESRYRFERGVDPSMVLPGLELATQMILEICGGKVGPVVKTGELPIIERKIKFNTKRVQELTGVSIEAKTSHAILSNLGFHLENGHVTSPSWRHDIEGDADLVEEIVRIVGYDHIPFTDLPKKNNDEALKTDISAVIVEERPWTARKFLANCGYHEVTTWSFIKPEIAKVFGGGEEELTLVNPISADLSAMRPSLVPNMLEAVRRNLDRHLEDPAFFEIGPIFSVNYDQKQKKSVSGVWTGKRQRVHWQMPAREVDCFDVKADLLKLLDVLEFDSTKIQIAEGAPRWYHPGRSGVLKLGPKQTLGYFGDFHPSILKMFDIQEKVVGFELFLSDIPVPKNVSNKRNLKLSPYQPVERDFAFLLDKNVPATEIIKAARSADPTLISSVILFDVYEGKNIPPEKKSIAFKVRLEPMEATLTDAQIMEVSDKIIKVIEQMTGGHLRQ